MYVQQTTTEQDVNIQTKDKNKQMYSNIQETLKNLK